MLGLYKRYAQTIRKNVFKLKGKNYIEAKRKKYGQTKKKYSKIIICVFRFQQRTKRHNFFH